MDCTDLKEGQFRLKQKLDGTIYFIERKDSMQIETNTTNGNIVKSRIKWTGLCECEILFLSQTKNSSDSIIKFLQDKPMKSKILKVAKDYYVFESWIDNVDFKYIDTMWIIKKGR